MQLITWFTDNFGHPLEWEGEVIEPVKLKNGYQWASGKHRSGFAITPSPVIWCTDKAYEWYKLRWL